MLPVASCDEPFFIVGSSRSGTTLLRLIISGHSRIAIPPETWFILPLTAQFSLREPLSAADAQRAVRLVVTHPRWPDFGLDAEQFARDAFSRVGLRLRDLIDLVYAGMLKNTGKQRIGDKTPPYIRIVPELAALYPHAKFIHLIRDGRDVAISFIDARFKGRCYHGARFEWTAAVRKGLEHRNSGLATRMLEIRYEDLVRGPEATIRRICDFLGEAFEPQMLEYREHRNLVPARGQRIHTKLGKPISEDAAGVWQHRLSTWQCFFMELCLRSELKRLGYPLRFGAPPFLPLLAASGALLRGASPILDRAIPFLQRRNLLPKPIYF